MSRVLIDRYQLGDVIGAGGAASVHRATDRRLGRDVAVKLLDDAAARSADPGGRERFLHEARSAAGLEHPHLVTVYDAGEDAGDLFLVMEYVDGPTLAQVIAREAPLPVARSVSIATQLLDALAAVHARGLIHRDIKPANVLLDGDGNVRLADFGIAKRLDDIEDALTAAGMVVGTPSHLAPEQARGEPLGPATDIYLVGLVLYEMLTGGRPPDIAGDAGGAAAARDPRAVRDDVPEPVALAVVRATDPDPADRFESAAAMRSALVAPPSGGGRRTALMPVAGAVAADPATTTMPERTRHGGHPTTAMDAPPVAALTAGDRPDRRRLGWLLVALVAALVIGLMAIADSTADGDDPTPTSTPTVTAPPTAPPTTAAPEAIAPPPAEPVEPADGGGGGEGKGKPSDNGTDNGDGKGKDEGKDKDKQPKD